MEGFLILPGKKGILSDDQKASNIHPASVLAVPGRSYADSRRCDDIYKQALHVGTSQAKTF